ncbi:MAG: DNA cytosine methyltransferase, partial [Cyanobacteria bacterium]|nr:DNA cytosine methyltransferase [Cyanobacteriota bacterium]
MTAYYNEIDPNAAEWLRQLIKAGAIAPGDVDERDIRDVAPVELKPYSQCHFFAGVGTWSYALRQSGWPDDRPVWTGSAPCQPFSTAGQRAGVADERHLWPAMFWLVQQCCPPVMFGEQVASADALRWWDVVATDLENQDYACAAVDLCAAGIGAPHVRQRLFWVAVSHGSGWQWPRQTQTAGRQHETVAVGGVQDLPLANPECSERRQISTGGDGQQYRKIEQRQAAGRPTGGGATDALGDPGQSRLQGDGAGFLRSPQESSERNPPQRAGDIPFWHDA